MSCLKKSRKQLTTNGKLHCFKCYSKGRLSKFSNSIETFFFLSTIHSCHLSKYSDWLIADGKKI